MSLTGMHSHIPLTHEYATFKFWEQFIYKKIHLNLLQAPYPSQFFDNE